MPNETVTSVGTILKVMKDDALHIVQHGTTESSLITLNSDKDGSLTKHGPYSLSVLQELLNGGWIERDVEEHDNLRPIFRLSDLGRAAASS